MKPQTIKNVNIATPNEAFFGNVTFVDGKITQVEKISKEIKKGSKFLLPGFFDSHTHGGYGYGFEQLADRKDDALLAEYIKKIHQEGITSILATTITQTVEHMNLVVDGLNHHQYPEILGWHMEGPYISVAKKGAHEAGLITTIDMKTLQPLLNKYPNKIKLMTIAPEFKENIEAIKILSKEPQTFVNIGHSNGSYQDAMKALNAGAIRYTHLYNGMSGYMHRNPGLVNAALGEPIGWVELIADNVHVDNDVTMNTFKICGPNRIVLISDNLLTKGLPEGDYTLGNLPIEKRKQHCYLKGQGTLAGSAMEFQLIAKNLKLATDCTWPEFVKMTSYNAACSFGIQDEIGDIKRNMVANFVIIDENINICKTYVNGQEVYNKEVQ